MSPTVQSRSRPSTMFRLLLGSASIASTAPGCVCARYLITIAEMVVLPTPPLPANAIVVVISLLHRIKMHAYCAWPGMHAQRRRQPGRDRFDTFKLLRDQLAQLNHLLFSRHV